MKTKNIFPEKGVPGSRVLKALIDMKNGDSEWKSGRMFGYVFHPGEAYAHVMETAYNAFLYESTLNPSAFKSLRKMETEAVDMVKQILHGDDHTAGSMTSGGTESIMMAMKVARDMALAKDKIINPEVIVPCSAHPAFDKAAHYLGIKIIRTPLGDDMRADADAMQKAVNPDTIMLAASAPSYPHGVVDPVAEIADIARRNNLYLHVDACMGGFMLPFLEENGYPVPPFDFRTRGVTSISVDAHKYGYACKGASFILYRNKEYRKQQYFITTEWPGGIFASSAFLGTKSGGPVAAAWTIMHIMGKSGYRALAKSVMQTAIKIREGINGIQGLQVIGKPDMTILSFSSARYNIFGIGNELQKRGWHLDRLQFPDGLHMTISGIHCGREDEFLRDLEKSVGAVAARSRDRFTDRLLVSAVKSLSAVLPEKQFRKIAALSSRYVENPTAKAGNSTAIYGITSTLGNRNNMKELVLEIYDAMYST